MNKQTHPLSSKQTRQFGLLLALVLLLSLLLRLIYLHNFEWGYDEGIHVLLAQLLAADYRPYSDLFVSYPPLFVWSLEWPWRIWGTVESIQLLMTLYALLGVAAVGILAYRLGGVTAGIIAAVILSVSATYLDGSRAVMTEVPSVGMATLSVGLAAFYYWSGRRGWLLASGLAMSASLMLKVLSPFVLGLVPLLVLVRQIETTGRQRDNLQTGLKNLILDGFIWSAGLLLPILLTLVWYDAQAMYRQVIAFRIDTRVTYQEDSTENIEMLAGFARDNWPLIIAALWGGGLIIFKQWRSGWFVLLWGILAIAFSLMQLPLRDKHLPLLLPPLAVLAGLGLASGLSQLFHAGRGAKTVTLLSSTAAILLAGSYLWQVGQELSTYNQTETQPLNEENRMLVEFLQQFTSPNDCLITDNPTLAFFANRLVPPNLSEVSSARLRTGYLTYDELVEAATAYNCQVVAPVDKRLKRTRADFVEWSKQNFVGLWLYDGGTEILLAQPLDDPRPDQPLAVTLGEQLPPSNSPQRGENPPTSPPKGGNEGGQVDLVGFDLMEQSRPAGQALYLSLYWRARQPFPEDYTIFVHLRDAANNTVANADHQPYNNLVPTSRWPVGRTIKETIRLDIPPDLPKGQYRLLVGMYSPETVKRLPVQNDASGENAVILPVSMQQNNGFAVVKAEAED